MATAAEAIAAGAQAPAAHRPLRRLATGSLRAKLILFSLLLVLVPGAVFAAIAIDSARRALERAVGRQLAEVAQDAAERVEAEIDRIVRQAARWSAFEEVRRLAADRAGDAARVLAELEARDPAPLALRVVDARREVVAESASGGGRARLATPSDLAAAMRAGTVVARSSGAGTPAGGLEVVAPIFDPERPSSVVGALVVTSAWDQLDGVLQHLQHDLAVLGLEVTLVVADETGRVVAGGSWEEPPALAGQSLTERGWRAPALGQAAARAGYVHDDAAGALVGYAPIAIAPHGMAALAVQPSAEALAPVHALRQTLVTAISVVLLGGLGVAVLVADRLSRPIRALTAGIAALARGEEPAAPVVVRSRDEIADLAAAFNRMAADLSRAREDLLVAAKFAFVGELAAGMAHEIRTPLGIVRSSAQILARSLSPGDARGGELIEMIVSEVDRLDRVVAGLLELARPHEPVLQSALLTPVLSRALDFLAAQASERGIALRRDFSAAERAVRCDPEQIYQVALNLVVNALQNVPRGGTVCVRTIAGPSRVGFEVADDGPGIAPELQQRIFAPFFTRRPGGTGLGLALVQRIVHRNRGTVTVDSAVGRGATFRVELPAAEEAA